MDNFKMSKIESELNILFDIEHESLIKGNLSKIDAIHQRKSILVQRLSELNRNCSVKPHVMNSFRKKAEHNKLLYEASLRGLKLASERIKKLQGVLGQLQTYDNEGRLANRASSKSTISIKA